MVRNLRILLTFSSFVLLVRSGCTEDRPASFLIPSGDRLLLRLPNELSTRSARRGEQIELKVIHELFLGNRFALPQGAVVQATVTESHRRSRVSVLDRAELRLELSELVLPGGFRVPLAANVLRAGFLDFQKRKLNQLEVKSEGPGKRETVLIAGGAARGAIAGGPVGAAVVGAVTLVSVNQTRARDVVLARGLVFEIELAQDLEIPASVPGIESWRSSRAAALSPSEWASRPGRAAPDGVPSSRPPRRSHLDDAAPSPEGFTVKVDVDLVTIDAVVRDLEGRLVDRLEKDDFRVLEDGAEKQISHFSRDQLPLAVALVVDCSGSVARHLEELRKAALETLGQLKPEDRVALFSFSDSVTRLVNLTQDRAAVAREIAAIEPSGGTNIFDAVFDAAAYLAAATADSRRAIILVSDNLATSLGRASESAAARMALEAEAVVYSIRTAGSMSPPRFTAKPASLGSTALWMGDPESVSRITKETGGEVLDAAALGSVSEALASVISRLKLRYTLGYAPAHKEPRGRFHRIELRLADRFGLPGLDYTIHSRRGYYY